MTRKHVFMGATIAAAILLWVGLWLHGIYQDSVDIRQAREIERQYASRNSHAANGGNGAGAIGRTDATGQRRRGGYGGYGGSGGQRAQRQAQRMNEMAKAVGLNPTQVKQVQAAQESTRSLMGNIFRNPNLSREQKQAQMQQIRASMQEQINKTLTPDQQTKYAAFQEKMRAEWQARRMANGWGQRQ
jgi:hypothetical protein